MRPPLFARTVESTSCATFGGTSLTGCGLGVGSGFALPVTTGGGGASVIGALFDAGAKRKTDHGKMTLRSPTPRKPARLTIMIFGLAAVSTNMSTARPITLPSGRCTSLSSRP